ncbi:MAG: translation initiation factor IF-2 [Thermotoga sp.]|nr:MAG: translation initiation factor IF-2 [Thermotoga sp.]
MGKRYRVYELARKLGMPSKELITHLKDLGEDVKSHMSTLDENISALVLEAFKEEKQTQRKEKKKLKKVTLPAAGITISDLAKRLDMEEKMLISKLSEIFNSPLSPNTFLKTDILITKLKLALSDVEITFDTTDLDELAKRYVTYYEKHPEELVNRPPVVTVMGHVDHGKTTLLDAIRSTNVAEKEAGGITQSVGAYQITFKGKKISFIDTPGHEAFTKMRMRGAQVTDIVVLLVAADDGVMPQTIEAYDHAKAAGVPIIVAINKIDKQDADVETTKRQIAEKLDLVPEEWGGNTIFVPISAKLGKGIDDLLEMILLISDMEDIKCYPKGRARGVILESRIDKMRGSVATVIIKDGILKIGDYIIAGDVGGKVKALLDENNKRVKEAGPSKPVVVLGFNGIPQPNSILYALDSRKVLKETLEKCEKKRFAGAKPQKVRLEDIFEMMGEKEEKVLMLILKADTDGALEALRDAIFSLNSEEIKMEIVHSGIGMVNVSDVMLASASNAVIIAFNVPVESKAVEEAKREKVEIRSYDVIFHITEDVERAMLGMLEPEYTEVSEGKAKVKEIFKVSNLGNIAGVVITEGYVTKESKVQIYRNKEMIYEGTIDSLKHFKDNVARMEAPQECGIKLSKFNDLQPKDELRFYHLEPVKRKLHFIKK